ncbi:MAG TPA: ribosome biogenesis GTPase YqeH [Fervidobacterium sp.]|nr:ribosome biogenesis GTPase YqeH [Fervidobacterium sp.]
MRGDQVTYKKTVVKCGGCGAKIQFNNPGKPGFIPADVYTKRLREGSELLCQRCFRIKHYGVLTSEIDEDELTVFLKSAMKRFKNVLYVFDVFDFEGTFRTEVLELINADHLIFVANKFDTLPKTVSGSQLKGWLVERIRKLTEENKNKNKITSKDIFITSAKSGFGLSKLKQSLEKLNGEVLVLGVTNVGKSSILRALTDSEVVVSSYPGTTIGLIEHRLKQLRLYDTPGIIVNDRMIDLFDAKCQAKVLAQGEVTRKTFKPFAEEIIFVGGLCRIRARLLTDPDLKPIFQILAPESVTFHKTQNTEFINNFQKHFGKLLVPPCNKMNLEGLEFREEKVIVAEEEELCIPGLCWISVKRGPTEFIVSLPKNVPLIIRPSLMKPKRTFNQNKED